MASNGGLPFAAASLLDVAVRAAVSAGAPRRTVAAIAAAVASVVMADLRSSASASGGASDPPSASKRRRQKRKKQAEKKRLATPASAPECDDGAAGRDEGSGETPVSKPAQAPALPAAAAPLVAVTGGEENEQSSSERADSYAASLVPANRSDGENKRPPGTCPRPSDATRHDTRGSKLTGGRGRGL